MGFAAVSLDAESIFADRREMGAAGNESHIRSGLGERSSIRPADAPGSDHRDAHPLLRVHGLESRCDLYVEVAGRSEEHTSELQSPCNLVCRLLLEKKKKKISILPSKQKKNLPNHT